MSYADDVSETITIAFTGDGVEDGSIDVRDLAPSLLALGDMLDAANRELHADASRISVRIRATGKGSFEVTLDLVMSLLQQVTTFFSGDTASGILNLVAFLGLGGNGVIQLLKWLRGRKPDRVIENEDGTVVLTIDGESRTVARSVVKLLELAEIRAAVFRFVEPLRRGDVSGIEVRPKGSEVHVLATQEDVPLILTDFVDVSDETVVESTSKAVLRPVTVAFQEGNKWRLSDGEQTFYATMADEGFLGAINENREAFGKGDVLICELHRRQVHSENGLRTEYTVLKVLEHKRAMRQLQLLPTTEQAEKPTSKQSDSAELADGEESGE